MNASSSNPQVILPEKESGPFSKTARGANANYDWEINFDKKVSLHLPFVTTHFCWNHRWAMNKGLESFKLEILRSPGRERCTCST